MNILPETWYCEGCDEPHATETAAADCCGHTPPLATSAPSAAWAPRRNPTP